MNTMNNRRTQQAEPSVPTRTWPTRPEQAAPTSEVGRLYPTLRHVEDERLAPVLGRSSELRSRQRELTAIVDGTSVDAHLEVLTRAAGARFGLERIEPAILAISVDVGRAGEDARFARDNLDRCWSDVATLRRAAEAIDRGETFGLDEIARVVLRRWSTSGSTDRAELARVLAQLVRLRLSHQYAIELLRWVLLIPGAFRTARKVSTVRLFLFFLSPRGDTGHGPAQVLLAAVGCRE